MNPRATLTAWPVARPSAGPHKTCAGFQVTFMLSESKEQEQRLRDTRADPPSERRARRESDDRSPGGPVRARGRTRARVAPHDDHPERVGHDDGRAQGRDALARAAAIEDGEDDDGRAVVQEGLALEQRREALADAQLFHERDDGHGIRRAQDGPEQEARGPGHARRPVLVHVDPPRRGRRERRPDRDAGHREQQDLTELRHQPVVVLGVTTSRLNLFQSGLISRSETPRCRRRRVVAARLGVNRVKDPLALASHSRGEIRVWAPRGLDRIAKRRAIDDAVADVWKSVLNADSKISTGKKMYNMRCGSIKSHDRTDRSIWSSVDVFSPS